MKIRLAKAIIAHPALSQRSLARHFVTSRRTVGRVQRLVLEKAITLDQLDAQMDGDIRLLAARRRRRSHKIHPDFSAVRECMGQGQRTLRSIWEDYRAEEGGRALGYKQFVYLYGKSAVLGGQRSPASKAAPEGPPSGCTRP